MTSVELQLQNGAWLWLLIPLWAYLIVWFKRKPANHQRSIADADPSADNHFYHPLTASLIQTAANSRDTQIPFWRQAAFWWQAIALSSLIISLSQPQLIGERLPDPPPERDIVFLVDTSISMQLKDYSLNGEAISRMDLLRNLLNEFATNMSGEHISVIVFAEQPYMLVPLSNDQNLIKRMLARITTTLAGRYTAVGDALLMALKEAKQQGDRHQTFIVFSDADKSLGAVTPAAAAKLVAENKIPVFTIAIGSSQKQQDQAVQGGLYQAVDLNLLKNLAETTGGNSYQVHDSEAMKQALQQILKQRQNLAEVIPQYERKTLYFYPLLLGLLMLIILSLLRLFGWQHAE